MVLMKEARRIGFTLVEMIVVISIIALLIALLIPALATARQDAIGVECESNLQSIGQMVLGYATANEGYLPSNTKYTRVNPRGFEYSWNDQLFNWAYHLPPDNVAYTTYEMSLKTPPPTYDGYTYQALQQKCYSLFVCPGSLIPQPPDCWIYNHYISPITYSANPNVFVWQQTYNWNFLAHPQGGLPNPVLNAPKMLNSINNPAQIVGVGDCDQGWDYYSTNLTKADYSFCAFDWTGYNYPSPTNTLNTIIPPSFNEPIRPPSSATRYGGTGLSYRHDTSSPSDDSPTGSANAMFMDGHAAPIKAGTLRVLNVATGF
jgi:prepilin-type N-terminal cleavage/methylation domain-containing protein/prepilin-type processing-associated H-X9-DG protein